MYSQVNWMMEFFRLPWPCASLLLTFYCVLEMLTYHPSFFGEGKRSRKHFLVNWVEGKGFLLTCFSVKKIINNEPARLGARSSSWLHCGDQCTGRRYHRQFLVLTVRLSAQSATLCFSAEPPTKHWSWSDTFAQRYFHFSDTLYQRESKSTLSISFSVQHFHVLVTG